MKMSRRLPRILFGLRVSQKELSTDHTDSGLNFGAMRLTGHG